jgi:hypothetical protein
MMLAAAVQIVALNPAFRGVLISMRIRISGNRLRIIARGYAHGDRH